MKEKRKKRFEKALAAAAALGAACALVAGMWTAIGAKADNASLPPERGDLTIHKYTAEDMDRIGDANDGTEVTVDSSFTPLAGATFNLWKVSADSATGDYPGAGPYRLTSSGLTDGEGNTFSVTAATTTSGTDTTPVGDVTTGADGTASVGNLDQGVYLVVEQDDDAIAEAAAPFTVAVPMTNAAGDGWISDVHVYPKNQALYVNKSLSTGADTAGSGGVVSQSGTAVNVGDTVHYSIAATVPDGVVAYATDADNRPTSPTETTDEDANVKFSIVDELDSALAFSEGSVKVRGMSAGSAGSSVWSSSGTEVAQGLYTVKHENGTVSVEFTDAGRLALYDAGYARVRVDLDAVVTAGVLDKDPSKIENTGKVNFTNRFGAAKTLDSSADANPDIPSVGPTVHTGRIDVVKKDRTSGAVLAGAKFKIADNEADAKAGRYLRKTDSGAIVEPADPRWADAADWEETSDKDGKLQFAGVEDYTSVVEDDTNAGGLVEEKSWCSYWLVETAAPDGYNLAEAPVQVAFTEAASTEATNWTVSGTVTDTNEFTLPLTGGPGAGLLVAAGAGLVGAAVALVAAGRRRRAHAEEA